MRLFKLIITLLIFCLLGVFIYQNLEIWNQPLSLKYNLYFVAKTVSVKLYILVLVSLLVGFFMGLTVLLKFHFKTRRSLKRERIEKELAQAAVSQKPNSQPATSHAPESGTGA